MIKLFFIFVLGFFLSGCEKEEVKMQAGPSKINACQEEEVSIAGYGDKGRRLVNCFVEYPGEPTREDKSYYIVEDICGQFTREFVENIVKQKIIEQEEYEDRQTYGCKYNLSTDKFITITLKYTDKKTIEIAGSNNWESEELESIKEKIFEEIKAYK